MKKFRNIILLDKVRPKTVQIRIGGTTRRAHRVVKVEGMRHVPTFYDGPRRSVHSTLLYTKQKSFKTFKMYDILQPQRCLYGAYKQLLYVFVGGPTPTGRPCVFILKMEFNPEFYVPFSRSVTSLLSELIYFHKLYLVIL